MRFVKRMKKQSERKRTRCKDKGKNSNGPFDRDCGFPPSPVAQMHRSVSTLVLCVLSAVEAIYTNAISHIFIIIISRGVIGVFYKEM